MTSPDDCIDDDSERERLDKYIDFRGIKDFSEFRRRVEAGFDTHTGRSFLNALSESKMRQWWDREQHKISLLGERHPLKTHEVSHGMRERVYFKGTVKGKETVVRRASVLYKKGTPREYSVRRYRDVRSGRFARLFR